MLFQQKNNLNSYEKNLVQNLLEKLIGNSKDDCRNLVENHDFTLLDNWNDKMGFVKEWDDRLELLCLYFDDQRCINYQVIIKKRNQMWAESKTFDYKSVREKGIVTDTQKDL